MRDAIETVEGRWVKVEFSTGFNFNSDAVSRETALEFDAEEEPSRTQQQFREECDINEIVRRFGLTGELPENFQAPVSGDFTGITDFQSALNAVIEAQEQFDSLPAEVRERFRNDPQQLMDFVADEKNRDEAVKIGLIPKPAEKTRDAVQAIDELAKVLTPK